MTALILSDSSPTTTPSTTATCYFSLPVSHTRLSKKVLLAGHPFVYSPDTTEAFNPLLAFRQTPLTSYMSSPGASRILQLQTTASHRPAAQPLQHRAGANMSSSHSSIGSYPSPMALLCCSRCRRESDGGSGMVQFGTNVYYCNHCARMTGYCAG